MIMAILGFIAPFIPDLLGMGKATLDHKFEKEMMKLRIDAERDRALYRMEEIEIQARTQENIAARQPHKSFGVDLLDKASESRGIIWAWSLNLAFLAFVWLDWIISFVRPSVTYYIFGLYGAIKITTMYRLYEITESVSATLMHEQTWTTFDQDMLLTIMGFWFGERTRRRARLENA